MTWFLVSWIAYACPGGMFGKLVPAALRPLACPPEARSELFSNRKQAYRAVKKAGCSAKLFWCKGLKCHAKKVTCPVELHIEGEKIK